MSDDQEYPKNPDYGQGRFRRRIRLQAAGSQVHAALEDCNHGFRCRIEHDGKRILRAEGTAVRVPFSTCPGAIEPLRALVGLPLQKDIQQYFSHIDASANCTHLLDLALLAARHALRGGERQLDITLEDQAGKEPAPAEIHINGDLVHRWMTLDWHITDPAPLAGNVLYKGFSDWANATFSGDEREAAFALQKGYFVGNARQYDLASLLGERANTHDIMFDVCHTYSLPQRDHAVRTAGTVRDFSDCPEQLLEFK